MKIRRVMNVTGKLLLTAGILSFLQFITYFNTYLEYKAPVYGWIALITFLLSLPWIIWKIIESLRLETGRNKTD